MATGLIYLYNALTRELNNKTTNMDKYDGWTPWVPDIRAGLSGTLSSTTGSASNQVGDNVGLVTCVSFTYAWDSVSSKKIIKLKVLPVNASLDNDMYISAGLIADITSTPKSINMVQLKIVPSDSNVDLILESPEDFIEGHEYVFKGEIDYVGEVVIVEDS